MKRRILCFSLCTWLSATAALACYPDPEFAYDRVGSADFRIAVAQVSDVEIVVQDTSCYVLSYHHAEYLIGTGPSDFVVRTCTDDIYQVDSLLEEAEGLTYLGFVKSAEVLVGLVRDPANTDSLRYAVPTCWGPLHYNLEKVSEQDRADMLRAIMDLASPAQ